jgi:precorrin-3B synthase
VLVSPLAGHGCGVHEATLEVAGALEAMLVGNRNFAVLPGKFGIVVDGGGPCPVQGAPGDIIVKLLDEMAAVSLDARAFFRVAPGDLVETAAAIIRGFIDQGPPARMRDADHAALLDAAGLSDPVTVPPDLAPHPIGDVGSGFGVGVAFGQLDAAVLRGLALLAADSLLFLTPWRSVMVTHAPAGSLGASLITDPKDIRLSISACIGMQGCEQATVDTLDDAAALAASGRLGGTSVHVSGCSKGCAHRGPAALTLVGENGRYNVVRNGRANEEPVLRGLSFEKLLALPALEEFV